MMGQRQPPASSYLERADFRGGSGRQGTRPHSFPSSRSKMSSPAKRGKLRVWGAGERPEWRRPWANETGWPSRRRPARLATLDKGKDQGTQSSGTQAGSRQVDRSRLMSLRFRDKASRQEQGAHTYRDVDQEDRASPAAGDVRLYERAADDLAPDGAQSNDHAVDGDGPDPARPCVENTDQESTLASPPSCPDG